MLAAVSCAGIGMETAEAIGAVSDLDFDFTVDDIDFGDFFLRLDDGGDALPDLEVDPADIFTDFEDIAAAGADNGVMDQEVPSVNRPSPDPSTGVVLAQENQGAAEEGKGECNQQHADEAATANNGAAEEKSTSSSSQEAESRHKRSSSSHGKKKAKVR